MTSASIAATDCRLFIMNSTHGMAMELPKARYLAESGAHWGVPSNHPEIPVKKVHVSTSSLSYFVNGITLHQMPRKLAKAQAAFAQTCQQLCGDGLQDGFCIFITARIVLAERVAAAASLFQSRQQCFLCAFQHRQRIKHRRCAHLAACQEDTAPTGRHRRHWAHCCQVTFRGHSRLHLQLQPEHRFCLFHVRSFF